jgi:Fe-S cluster assembly protein SufD
LGRDSAAPAAIAEPDWLTERRRKGAALTSELVLPGQKQRGWEFTDLTDLDLDAYPASEGRIEGLEAGVDAADGPPVVLPLREATERLPDLVGERFGSLVSSDDPFVARNERDWRSGVLVYVPRGQRLDKPVQLSVYHEDESTALDWRALIVLEEGAEAEVWERYVSDSNKSEGLFNGVVELSVGAGANLRYVCEQELSERSWVFAMQRAELQRDASLEWVALGFGSARGKVRMETKLAGAGSSAKVTGAYAGAGAQHLDFDTTQEHAAEHTTSDLAFRGVLSDRATAVWRGMVRVDPGAQQTDAFQECRNLLLSKQAHADAIPGLEIEANDVRCTHAVAVAQVDREQLYYLRARGLPEPRAKRLIVDGFLQELAQRTTEGPVRDALSAALDRRLGQILPQA